MNGALARNNKPRERENGKQKIKIVRAQTVWTNVSQQQQKNVVYMFGEWNLKSETKVYYYYLMFYCRRCNDQMSDAWQSANGMRPHVWVYSSIRTRGDTIHRPRDSVNSESFRWRGNCHVRYSSYSSSSSLPFYSVVWPIGRTVPRVRMPCTVSPHWWLFFWLLDAHRR